MKKTFVFFFMTLVVVVSTTQFSFTKPPPICESSPVCSTNPESGFKWYEYNCCTQKCPSSFPEEATNTCMKCELIHN